MVCYHVLGWKVEFRFYADNKLYLLGQCCWLQLTLSVKSPLQTPPYFSRTDFVLVFSLVPPPQVKEQTPMTHSLHSQLTKIKQGLYLTLRAWCNSIGMAYEIMKHNTINVLLGQFWLLQGCCNAVVPIHSCPPFCATTDLVRVFVRVPPPQVTEHSLFVQSLQTQSTLGEASER